MSTIYDSGWVPNSIGVAPGSGSVKGVVRLDAVRRARVIFAASGSAGVNNGSSAAYLSWSAGSASPIPWSKNMPAFPTAPYITGNYAVSAPGAGAATSYYFGSNMSGANHLDDWVPSTIYVGLTPGSASYARVIVEGT